jgi:predicted MFS family arabinose efflux permease
VFLAAGSVASAAAPTFVLLALAQVPIWTGVAILMTAGVAATAAWSASEDRTKIVARALAGAPAAWIVGMPIIGLVGEVDWRLAFLVLPLPASVVALALVARRPSDVPIPGTGASLVRVLSRRDARGWAIGEFLATSGWAGTLVFSGALFTEVHGTSPAATGVALALVAAAYLAGNQWAGRSDSGRARRAMLTGTTVAAAAVALTWAIAPTFVVTVALFSVAAFVVATRTVAATVYGFSVTGGFGREVGMIRSATSDIAYLVGSMVGGAALAVGGFQALALAFGSLFVAATLPYVRVRGARRAGPTLQPTS